MLCPSRKFYLIVFHWTSFFFFPPDTQVAMSLCVMDFLKELEAICSLVLGTGLMVSCIGLPT